MNPKIRIDGIRANHTPDLRRLFRRAVAEDFNYFPDQHQQQVLRENSLSRLALATIRPQRLMIGAWREGQLIGYAIAGTNGNGSGKLYWLYVSPEGRGLRLGSQLLNQVIEQMQRRGLERISLVTHNYDAYYAKHGFIQERSEVLYGVPMKVMSYRWQS